MEFVNTVVIGASAFGLGFALGCPDGAVVLESGALLASEFIASLAVRRHDFGPLCPGAAALREECRRNGLFAENGVMHAFPVAPLLARRAVEAGLDIRFLAWPIDRQAVEGGWLVTYFDALGSHALSAKRCVDTRAACGGRKALNAIACGPAETPVWAGPSDVTLTPCRYPGEAALTLALPEEADWPDARARLYGAWAGAAMPGWRLAAVAPVFSRLYDAPVLRDEGAGLLLAPSASYPDLLYAFQGGLQCAIRQSSTAN